MRSLTLLDSMGASVSLLRRSSHVLSMIPSTLPLCLQGYDDCGALLLLEFTRQDLNKTRISYGSLAIRREYMRICVNLEPRMCLCVVVCRCLTTISSAIWNWYARPTSLNSIRGASKRVHEHAIATNLANLAGLLHADRGYVDHWFSIFVGRSACGERNR